MVRVKNDPARYVTRSKKLPSFEKDAEPSPCRVAERERAYRDAPINEGFYIDYRKQPRR